MLVAQVVLDDASARIDRPYSYRLPAEGAQPAVGSRVLVPFGPGDRRRVGLVLGFEEHDEEPEKPEKLKTLLSVIDERPLLGEEGLSLLHFLHETSFCRWFEAYRALVPLGAAVRSEYRLSLPRAPAEDEPLSPRELRILEAAAGLSRGRPTEGALLAALGISASDTAYKRLLASGLLHREPLLKSRIPAAKRAMLRRGTGVLSKKPSAGQERLLALIDRLGEAPLSDALAHAGVSRAVADRLLAQGVLARFEAPVPEASSPAVAALPAAGCASAPVLSADQAAALSQLEALCTGQARKTALLYGVTGSGKTSVYLALIERVLAAGRRVLVLVPEIALTPQTLELFTGRLGAGRLAVLHSGLSPAERLATWRRVRQGGADVVIGTRSAVFAPLENIGLIVMDEEQSPSYHSEAAPRFHARDVARFRAARHKALLLLCSATPGIESYYRAQKGGYALVTLPARYSGAPLPETQMIDMREAALAQGCQSVSQKLAAELSANLEKGEQSILLLNRRGFYTLVKCSACGQVLRCKNCSIALTYHRATESLVCHYCGYTASAHRPCPACGSPMVRYTGAGTQQLEEELGVLLPEARILRMDSDTVLGREAYQRAFSDFAKGKYDIMVGTQMVAKGLNFPNVTLVGVLCADQSLYSDDFRSYEKAFSLFAQVVGRGGRGKSPGRAFIQTFSPESPVLELAARQDYTAFYAEEILFRKSCLYPPFCELACLLVSCEDEALCAQAARWLHAALERLAMQSAPALPLRLLRAVPAYPARLAGRSRWRILLKCRRDTALYALLESLREEFFREAAFKKVALVLDMVYDGIG